MAGSESGLSIKLDSALNRPVEDSGQTAGRCRRRQRNARPPAASRPRAEVRTSKLAHQDSRRFLGSVRPLPKSLVRLDAEVVHAANVQPRQRSALPLAATSTKTRVVECKGYRALPLVAVVGSGFKSRRPDQSSQSDTGGFLAGRESGVDNIVDGESPKDPPEANDAVMPVTREHDR